MKIIDKETFLRSFKVLSNQSFDLFLGAGASISSGIPSGGDLVWHFKREILNSNGKINIKKFQDLKIEDNKKVIQSFFEETEENNIINPYSYYFNKCYPDPLIRKEFLTNLVRDKKPSIGFMCLSALVEQQKINTVWTTNFDDLIEKAINGLNYKSCQIVSPENVGSVNNFRSDIPTVVKLHGDFRYDPLQNTDEELQKLEESLHKYFVEASTKRGLLVMGYSGSDESVLQSLEKALEENNAFPKGLIWCIPKSVTPNQRLIRIISKANEQNQRSGFMIIDSFDYFLHELYKICDLTNDYIDSITKERFEKRQNFRLNQTPSSTLPILLNAIKAKHFPKSTFLTKTNISGIGKWKRLRDAIGNSSIVGSFGKNDSLRLFGSEQDINNVLKNYLIDDLKISDIPEHLFFHSDSFYIGMLYELIEKCLIKDYGLSVCAKGRTIRKFYSIDNPLPESEIADIKKRNNNFNIDKNISVFEAFEFSIEFINKELFLLICPTIHIETKLGGEVNKNISQYLSNTIISNRYNNKYGKKLNWWINELKKYNKDLVFKLGDFEIRLTDYYSTGAKRVKDDIYCFDGFTKLSEPSIYFHYQDEAKQSIHPISGLKILGPLEESFEANGTSSTVNLAIITPDFGFAKLKTHLESLLNTISPIWEKEYLKEFPGFDNVFKKHLIIPNSIQSEYVISIPNNDVKQFSAIQFYDYLKSKIDRLALKSTDIDCVVIYIPDQWKNFRELKNENTYYDLHDSLKLYCVKKGLRIQFIEDKSINYKDQAKIRWWLSLGLYVKSNGTPWKIKTDNTETAFVGLGYAIRQNVKNKVVLGSSQIFDGYGNGLKFLLQPIEKPIFYNKNPFMSKEDAFRLISNIRNTYHKIDPVIGLKKLVLHKTTHFTSEEIEGISNALEGIDNIELLQIQQFSSWRAIKLIKNATKHDFNGYPIDRGTIIQLDDFSFLLWTHGLIENQELNGKYYQGKRGIPAPLLIKRFRGTDPIETVANDILKLTKMNWNGAELYKTFPVTIDFSKKLSVMGKQLEELGNKAYDFRYFI
ncbi:SIR2 family protein [Elizabethkingia anophelis]|uniref:SIR2 family protein n=1 Tax=Elizabethkingia anophelis TaxID=1117645 RepID=UPI00320B5CA5